MSDPWSSAPSCVSSLVRLCAQNCDCLPPPPPTHTFLKRPFLTDFKKHTHTHPYGTKFWCIGPKLEKTPKNCEFAPCWHKPDVPERYIDRHVAHYIALAGAGKHLLAKLRKQRLQGRPR